MLVPSGSVLVPSGAALVPSGAVLVPSGAVLVPSGSVLVPSGSVFVPSGSMLVVSGSAEVISGVAVVTSDAVVSEEGIRDLIKSKGAERLQDVSIANVKSKDNSRQVNFFIVQNSSIFLVSIIVALFVKRIKSFLINLSPFPFADEKILLTDRSKGSIMMLRKQIRIILVPKERMPHETLYF